MPSQTELDTRVLDAIIKNLGGNVANAVAKAAPVDTGALRASIYTSLQNGVRGTDAMGEAHARNPQVETHPLPTPNDNHTAYVGPSVEYGAAIELGSVRRAGTPYLQPAVRETEDEFRKLLGDAVVNK
jgi:hypothetical protein